ncbi:MAG TPA: trypsin-like peptidase domain-containing protein, partial [Gemmataceae bacterium]|nr:trypsin-like peptidase domain-containing protein [Gemmataceae bacterium]
KGCVVIAVDARRDLSLLRYNDGPFPFVSPVAAAGFHAGPCLSVGYDELKIPAQCRPATILESQGTVTFTRERPWHGRSGGGLIDRKTGSLVGVVSAYTGPSNHRELCPGEKGVYVRHESVLAFLAEIGRGQGFEQQERRPEISYQREYAQPEPWAPRPQIFEQRQFAPQQFPGFAPGGSCPPGRP